MESSKQVMPLLPGIYLFKRDTEIIYVGKAKSIRKRSPLTLTNKLLIGKYKHLSLNIRILII